MVPFTPQSICLLLTPVSRPGSNFPAPPPAAQAAVTFAKYSADFPFAATRTDSLLSSSASYAAMHARAAQGTGSSLTSSSSSSAAAPRHTSQQAPRVHDRGSLDSTGTQPGPIPHRTKWLPAACLPARARGDGSCDGALDNALRASYEAIAQVDLLRVVLDVFGRFVAGCAQCAYDCFASNSLCSGGVRRRSGKQHQQHPQHPQHPHCSRAVRYSPRLPLTRAPPGTTP